MMEEGVGIFRNCTALLVVLVALAQFLCFCAGLLLKQKY